MRWSDVPDDKRDQMALLKAGPELEAAAESLGLKASSLTTYLSQWRNRSNTELIAAEQTLTFPPQSTRHFDDFLVVDAEDGMFISDIHIPNGDAVWLETALVVAVKQRVRNLFLLGDILDSNQQGISTWASTWVQEKNETYSSALKMLRQMLRLYLMYFENIYIITGNHDQRVAKATGGQVDLGAMLSEFDARLHFSNYGKMYITNHRGYIAAYHQRKFSDNGITVGRAMYETENFRGGKPYAVITTHCHQWACGKSKDNLAALYALGASEDDSLSQYANEVPSAFAKRNQSMIVMKKGFLRNLERNETDWDTELGQYAAKASICQSA